jgi:serine/threonine protein kinase
LLAIEYLHSKNIIHRDIKPSNIFINGPNLVIGDLGQAKNFDMSVVNSKTMFGTFPYNAPETFEDEGYTKKIDIWSFGCVLYEMIKLEKLFNQKGNAFLLKIISYDVDKDLILQNDKDIEPFFLAILKKYNWIIFNYLILTI